jgi:hypothetical protein
VDVVTQTDAFMDQLFAPMFIPMKTGGAWTGRDTAGLLPCGLCAAAAGSESSASEFE